MRARGSFPPSLLVFRCATQHAIAARDPPFDRCYVIFIRVPSGLGPTHMAGLMSRTDIRDARSSEGPRHAIVLAAGEGSRLRPLVKTRPKPMLPVANRPILHHVVDALSAAGVTRVTLVVGYRRERVQSYFQDGAHFGVDIDYAFQDALLGTSHALACARVRDDVDDVLVVSGDNTVDAQLVRDLRDAGNGACVAGKPSATPSRYGVITTRGDLIQRIEEQPRDATSIMVSTGAYRLPRKVIDRMPELLRGGHAGIPQALQALIDEGEAVRLVESRGTWMDAVHPWDLLSMNARLLATTPRAATPMRIHSHAHVDETCLLGQGASVGPHAVVTGATSVGRNVSVGAGAIVDGCILMDDAVVGAGSVLRNTIVGEGARLMERVTALSGPTEVRASDGLHALRDFGCVIGPDVTLGGAVTLAPGVLVGSGARIAHGRTIERNAEDGAIIG